jgi:hypothetical protein
MPLEEIAVFVAEVLPRASVEYVVIGGIAVGVFGKPRSTRDVDVVFAIPSERISNVLDELAGAGLVLNHRANVEAKLKAGRPAKILWDKKFSLDLRLATFSIDLDAIAHAASVTFQGRRLAVARPEELIVYKLARFSDQDRGDIRNLMQIQAGALRWPRIKKLAGKLAEESGLTEIPGRLDTISRWR